MPSPRYEKLAEQFERPARIVREFGMLADQNPEDARDLLGKLSGILDVRGASNGMDRRGPTQTDQVVALFVESRNTGMTKADIVEKTGINRNSVHGLLYKTGKFEPVGKSGRQAVFRLTNEAYRAAVEAAGGNQDEVA
ncbi:MAG: hypothetical protein GY715_14720 [Planctomycetes bacterium]|nr:hypothetical protein [Planctomycetota bacterium]